MQYTPDKDLAPITLSSKCHVLVVNRSCREICGGAGSPTPRRTRASQLRHQRHRQPAAPAGELLEQLSGTPFTHIPYRGASNQLTDTAGGSIDMTFRQPAGAKAVHEDGRVRPSRGLRRPLDAGPELRPSLNQGVGALCAGELGSACSLGRDAPRRLQKLMRRSPRP